MVDAREALERQVRPAVQAREAPIAGEFLVKRLAFGESEHQGLAGLVQRVKGEFELIPGATMRPFVRPDPSHQREQRQQADPRHFSLHSSAPKPGVAHARS
jgi:hypothetical protein